ncbi:hypothetical protein H112_03567 [Trichophyton rubrum D6]|uniref:Uncharacterized protein n=3 Tax=Trichophyton TaxID=5550 RepID=A0A080WLS4_TRIRC|nr:uncharacterized protein TERG_12202 [Trichophyton rubrum CBS 118892]EZF23786.1 hypothetical protein H100_03572 [Trichophyton rubrum MR850]EZF42852.1 hypothetical protein H102_03565 [Trichophyton rubrum CBS 100081]EZF53481.1 hypothetical protein H103_03575 [Trichophyton rubrum CBS 288.86]EZF64099.1 hypothetical protein H104_03562 [Trichophyton rubrum CBS 289.86]EZF74703.1 hypothetical protein H105_03590 [Trichophyton soudanense CBS 452.61]EZF85394.1 hypothetical protein H110_03574 [Trichophy
MLVPFRTPFNNPGFTQLCLLLFNRGWVWIEEMLIVLRKHAQSSRRIERIVYNACKKLFGDTTTIDASFHSVKLVNKRNLDRLLECLPEWVKLLKGIFKKVFPPYVRMVFT